MYQCITLLERKDPYSVCSTNGPCNRLSKMCLSALPCVAVSPPVKWWESGDMALPSRCCSLVNLVTYELNDYPFKDYDR
jgi:hypothetical protein